MSLPRGFFSRSTCVLFTAFLFAAALCAQVTTARLDGTVRDSSGAIVPGAKVRVVEKRTQISASSTSNSEGNFVFSSLLPGTYELSVEATGFRKAVLENIELAVAGTVSQIVKLEVGQATESVMVEATSAAVQTTDSDLSRAIAMKEVDLLPQLGRTPISLAIFQAGVQIDIRAGQDSSFSHVNGLRQGSNNSMLDGVDVNDSVAPRLGLSLTANNSDSVEEFRVTTAAGKAEYGRSAGAQVELITRSGTNLFHGAAYDYLRNTDLNANDFFNNLSNIPVPQLIRNLFGGSFGGPIKHNKTFIFGNYQGTRTHQATVRSRTVPTDSMKAGIFKYKAADGSIQQYSIVANDPLHLGIDPQVAKLFSLYPEPNNTSLGDGLNTSGFTFNNPTPSLEDQFTIRADHRLTDSHLLFLRWSWQRNTSIDALNNADATFPGQIQGSQGGHRWGFSAGSTWTVRPDLVNDFRAGHQSSTVEFLRPNRPSGPAISFNSITNIEYTAFGQGRNSPVNEFTDTITKVFHNHTFKAGASLRFTNQYGYNYSGVYPTFSTSVANGAVVPAGSIPAGITGTTLTTYQQVFNDVLGRISGVTQTYYSNLQTFQPAGQPRVRNYLLNEGGYFFQDDWRITRRLTLNIGLRYDYFGVPHERDSLQGVVTPANLVNGVNQVDNLTIAKSTSWYNKDLNNFAPRFGFAFDPFGDGKTAIRGFYGIYFDRSVGAAISGVDGGTPGFSQALNVPTTVDVRFNQNPAVPPQPTTVVLTPPATRSLSSLYLMNPNLRTGYVHSYNFNIQRQLKGNFTVEAGYVGNRGVKLYMDQDVNQPRLSADFVNSFKEMQGYAANASSPVSAGNFFVKVYGSAASAVSSLSAANFTQGNVGTIIQSVDVSANAKISAAGISQYYFRSYPQFQQVIEGTNNGRSDYDSLQIRVNRRTRNLSVSGNYTFSRSEDNISSEGNGFTTPIDNFNLSLNKAKADFDRPHSFNGTAIYTLPVGRNQKFGGNMPKVADLLIGGWDTSALVVMQSGQPFSVSSQHSTLPVSGVGNTYAQYAGTDTSIGSVQRTGSGVFYFTPAQTALFSAPGAFQLGNSGRNVFRNPTFNEVDMSLGKKFRITERNVVSFRAEAYNVFNHPNFGLAAANLNINNPTTFGKFSSTLGTQVGGSSARTMQMALRYDF